jgi:hypothetical protein
LNEDVKMGFFDTREHLRQWQKGFQRFEVIDVFESFIDVVIHGYGDIPEVEIKCSDVIKVRSLLLLNQLFEDADSFVLQNFDSEHPIEMITENKAVEREKLSGIEKWKRLNYFQRY